ncbi:MAG: YecA family protein [Acidimicrobiales bacterium]
MEEAKVKFLFGEVPAGLDPDDLEDRATLLAREAGAAGSAAREAIATQIAEGNPPEVWATAERLVASGFDRHAAMGQLALAITHAVHTALEDEGAVDPVEYVAALAGLPLPTAGEIERTLIDVVRSHQGIDAEEADGLVLAALRRGPDDELVRMLVDRVTEQLVDDDGPLAWLADDRTVHVGDLTAGVVMTHRLSDTERRLGLLNTSFDLAAFVRRDELRLPDGRDIELYSDEPGHLAWGGPEGWLDGHGVDELLAVRVGDDGVVSVDSVREEPAPDATLVARLRRAYDLEVYEPGLPVSGEDLVLGLLLEDRDTFSTTRPPLAELCEAAGLERRRHEVAHDQSIWTRAARLRRTWRVAEMSKTDTARAAAYDALDAADDPDATPERLRQVLSGLRDPEVLDVVADELLGFEDDAESVAHTVSFAERLLQAAQRPGEIAVARWLAAVAAERYGEVLVADAHLTLAVEADPDFLPAVDRAAWYASDKGDATTAARLWRRLPIDASVNADLAMVERFARPSGPKLGRNEPCWCGSGRKYKVCHLGRPQPVALSERVGWLCRKATAYLERRGGSTGDDVMSFAEARAVDPSDPETIADALDDPIVIDAALTEGGWFDRFLTERGPLLPDDEALLAAAWALVPRSVYEVVDTRPGAGLALRDLGTGDRLDVRERSYSRQARPGQVFCGRAVPDGDTHQLVGSVFPVAPGTEADVLELCDEGRGHEICDYVARQHRPPTLQTREGEPLISCSAVVEVPDPVQARLVLDNRYRARDGEWIELHAINDDEEILRAQLHLDGRRITITTNSEARMDRVLDALRSDIPRLEVVSDEREPVRPHELATRPLSNAVGAAGPPVTAEFVSHVQEQMERRWLAEHVPALAGLTPVEAADDPTRVEQLERLLDTFPEPSSMPEGAITMRPDHLRELLGLAPRNRPG